MTHDLSARLARLLRGREPEARSFTLSAVRGRNGFTHLAWRDEATGEAGYLGSLAATEVPRVVPLLFRQLRAWRELAEVTNRMASGRVKATERPRAKGASTS